MSLKNTQAVKGREIVNTLIAIFQMAGAVTYLCDRGTCTEELVTFDLDRPSKKGQCRSKLRAEVAQLQESVEEITIDQVEGIS